MGGLPATDVDYVLDHLHTKVDVTPRVELVAIAFGVGRGELVATARLELDGPPVLCDLFVNEDHRRRGLGTALVERGISIAKVQSDMPVYVYYRPDSPARQLFEGMQFEPTGERGFEWSDIDYIWAQHAAHHSVVPYRDRLEAEG